MTETHRCPQCGAELPAAAPEGLCPKCLLLAGFESQAQSAAVQPTASSPPASGFVPPTVEQLAARFPQLEVLELLGKGGMGAVYKARQPGLDRLVAVKILPPEVGRDPAFAERFTREARALARLNHPNIVSVYDFGQSEGLFYIVMEFVGGVNLRQAIRAGEMSPQDALAVVPQICDALQFAHDEGIVHRDIKPENILLDKRGRVKIADFGLAKLVGPTADPTLTAEHQVMGTLRYMAPEQLEGTHSVDHRADIYSLGVVFYELLTGELPLGRFAPPSQKVEIDVRLDEVVLRALEKAPEQRYQQASELKTGVANATSRPRTVNVIPRATASHGVAQPSTHQPDARAKVRFAFGYFVICSLIFAVAFFAALPLWGLRYPGLLLGGTVIFAALYFAAVGRRRFSLVLANRLAESPRRRAVSLLLGLILSIAGYYFVQGGNLVLAERSEWCFIPRDVAAFEQTYTGKEYQLVRQLSAYQKSVPKAELLPNGANWSSGAILPLFQDVGPFSGLFDSSFSIFFQFGVGFLLLADGALAVSSVVWATRKINWRHDIGPLLAIALALPVGWCVTSMAASSLAGILQFQHGAGGFENGTSSVFSVNSPLDDVRRTMETALDAEGYQLGDTAMWMMRTVPEGDKIGDTGFELAWKPSAFDRWHWHLGTLAASCPKVSVQFIASDKPSQTVVQISLGQVSDAHVDREPWPAMFNRLIEAGKATRSTAERTKPQSFRQARRNDHIAEGQLKCPIWWSEKIQIGRTSRLLDTAGSAMYSKLRFRRAVLAVFQGLLPAVRNFGDSLNLNARIDMKISNVFVIAAVAGMMALTSSQACAGTIVADWTLSNDATGYSGGSTTSGVPLDSVGGHNFENGFGNNTPGSSGSVGGPSSTSSQWNGGGGWYATQAGTTAYPTDNFSVEVHASVGSLSEGILFSSDGNASGDLQIGEDSSGNWVAFVSSNGQNYPSGSYSGIEVGSAPIIPGADYDLKVTDLDGVFSFFVNGVSTGPGVTPPTFGGFSAPHIAVAPGGSGPNYSGSASDLTITSGVTAVPEPASVVLFGLGLGAVGLTLAIRCRTDANFGS